APMGVMPYEWVDASVNIDQARHAKLVALIEALSLSHGDAAAAASLGVAINYRFRPLGSRTAFSTFEERVEDGKPARVRLDDLGETRLDRSVGQVAWSAYAPAEGARDVRAEVVQELELVLRELSTDDGESLLERLAVLAERNRGSD